MKKLIIIADSSCFDFKKKQVTIGGVQTYILDLAHIGIDNGFTTTMYALDKNVDQQSIHEICNCNVVQFPSHGSLLKSANQQSFEQIYLSTNESGTVYVISTDQMDIKSNAPNVINIQHGIAFDVPGYLIPGIFGKYTPTQNLVKLAKCIKNIIRFNHVRNTVCVDYNFFNWYRTLGTITPDQTVTVIPNYSSSCISEEELRNKLNTPKHILRILFARRFVDYRGTTMFANVVKSLYNEGFEFETTFAGDGPLKSCLFDMFKNNPFVNITSFSAKDSIGFHKNYDVAVVPTIFSEGTSLSLNEAMSAGCFPVCTYVGGMSNMIIDGYNGLSVYPDEKYLLNALKNILSLDEEYFKNVVKNAYDSATRGFNKAKWEDRWLQILNLTCQNEFRKS